MREHHQHQQQSATTRHSCTLLTRHHSLNVTLCLLIITSIQPACLNQCSHTFLQRLTQLSQRDARFCDLLNVGAGLFDVVCLNLFKLFVDCLSDVCKLYVYVCGCLSLCSSAGLSPLTLSLCNPQSAPLCRLTHIVNHVCKHTLIVTLSSSLLTTVSHSHYLSVHLCRLTHVIDHVC